MSRYSLGGALVLAFITGCSGADWNRASFSPGYRAEQHLNVAVRVQAHGDDIQAAVNELSSTLQSDLASEGIRVTFVSTEPPPPGVSVTVTHWDPGNRAERWLGFGGGEGTAVLAVTASRADGTHVFEGVVQGYVRSGFAGGSAMNSIEEAAHAVARALREGKAELRDAD
jgi:hypothetical protein